MAASASVAASSRVEGMLVEYAPDPLGTDARRPGFSWKMVSDQRGTRQSAYQVRVASSKSLLTSGKPDLWDSGKVQSSRSVAVPYDGQPLTSRARCFWQVRIWDGTDAPTAFSEPAAFEMALLDEQDWRAQWIGASDEEGGNGYHSQFADSAETVKWVQVDLGEPTVVKAVVLRPARPYNWKHDVPGFGFPIRYRIELSDAADFADSRIVADRTADDQPNPGAEPVTIPFAEQKARYVRLTATKLHQPQDARPMLAMAEMNILGSEGENVALNAEVTALDSIEDGGWSARMLTNGSIVSRAPNQSAPIFRREFRLDQPVTRARAYVTGLGYYELRMNGEKVGDRVLDPPYTNFHKRVYYSTYDIAPLLKQGANCVAVMLGRGWWREPPRLLVQIEVTYKDGKTNTIVSGEGWKWARGPIVSNSLYDGESYDARAETRGWDLPGFDDSAWQPVVRLAIKDATLSAQAIQPIKVVETLRPKALASPKPGVYVFDLGQNISGWCRIRVNGPAGTSVSLRHAETLYDDGTVNQENLRSAKATDTYILRGEGDETWEPRFTYHGFRYVQVEGWPVGPYSVPPLGEARGPGTPTLDSIDGRVVHTSFEPRGSFECSNEMLNKVQQCSLWGERTNFHSIPTDCPQRDERQGWMGDAHMSSEAMLLNFDMPRAYTKFLQDIQDAQREDGAIPDTVPHVWGSNPGDPMWSAAYPLVLWDVYRHTGDSQLLRKHYDGIKLYVDMLRREAPDFIIERNNYGDWIAVVGTPKELVSTGSFYLVTSLLVDMATALGKKQDAKEYRAVCGDIARAFNARFLDTKTGRYGNGSQFSYAFPLYLGIVPDERKQAVLGALVHDTVENHKGHLSTGFVGTPYLMDSLTSEGRADVAYGIATQEDYPGWGYMIARGATTIWELWKYEVGPGMNSHNHPALGWVSEWFYSTLAGLRLDTGWEHFAVKPHVLGDLKWVWASVETVRGKVASSWELRDSGISLQVTVPANSTATVMVPRAGLKDCVVTEGGKTIWQDGAFRPGIPGVRAASDAGEWIRVDVGSGEYRFELAGSR